MEMQEDLLCQWTMAVTAQATQGNETMGLLWGDKTTTEVRVEGLIIPPHERQAKTECMVVGKIGVRGRREGPTGGDSVGKGHGRLLVGVGAHTPKSRATALSTRCLFHKHAGDTLEAYPPRGKGANSHGPELDQ